MDQFKKHKKEISNMERHLGRMMRNMALPRMIPVQSDGWFFAADVYETETDFIVYMDVSGIDPADLNVSAETASVTVNGERRAQIEEKISRIHLLEVERGFFERRIPLPGPVDITAVSSVYKNGFLIIRMPKQKKPDKIKIEVG